MQPHRVRLKAGCRSAVASTPASALRAMAWQARAESDWLAEPKLAAKRRAKAGARGGTCTRTGDALDVVPLRWATRAARQNGASRRCCPGRIALQKESAGCCMEAKWSQSPVPPRTQRAYETLLSAGSTAMMAHGHPNGAPTRSCTGLTRLPSECIADNALRAKKLASLTGFAPVISCMRGRRVGWTTPRGQVERVNGVAPSSRPWQSRILLLNHTRRKLVRASGNAPDPGTHLVRCGV